MTEPFEHAGFAPQTVVTLKVANEKDKTLWVTESIDTIHERKYQSIYDESANTRDVRNHMIRLTRWTVKDTSDFWTRTDNIVSLEAYA
jgi:hypothetical protein